MNARQIAEAFSGHEFEEVFPFIADDVLWTMPGAEGLEGRDAVIAACRSTAEALKDTRVTVERFVVIDGGQNIAVDSLTVYGDPDSTSVVASCDIYEFRDGMISRITSYTVEV